METLWFTADTHFGHTNIIKYCNRPFSSVEEMDATIIANWNARVGKDDAVYHLGDVALCSPERMRQILKRLNGRIHLIRGNHESSALACEEHFEWVRDYHELHLPDPNAKSGRQMICLMHYAMREWNRSHRGSWNLFGHSHGSLADDPHALAIDVGVDCHGFVPLSYHEIAAIMARKDWTPPF